MQFRLKPRKRSNRVAYRVRRLGDYALRGAAYKAGTAAVGLIVGWWELHH